MQQEANPEVVAENPLDTNRILNERYRLLRILGQGSFGAAFLADDAKLGRACVVKQMLLPTGRSTQTMSLHVSNFEREASLLAQLNAPGHPNIPEIYDYFTNEQGTYLVMKYIEGQSLEAMLEPAGTKVVWQDAVRYMLAVCSAVHYMQTSGPEPILHRDIKPANILLGNDDRVWLVDFGLAKAKPVEGNGDLMATQSSGSIGYSALEQWLGQAVPASDVYSIGATLHHLVTGLHPAREFGDMFDFGKLNELHGQFEPIRKIDRRLSQPLEEIIIATTATDSEMRPSPLQLQQELEALVAGPKPDMLFTFKNGEIAKTNKDLVWLCQQNPNEAEGYLYNGDFERWFRLINRNDLANAATQAVTAYPAKHKRGLKRFYKLVLPNLFFIHLRRFAGRIFRLFVKLSLALFIITALLTVGAVYATSFALQQAIESHDWQLSTLDFVAPNTITEDFVNANAPIFLNLKKEFDIEIDIDVQPPSQIVATVNNVELPVIAVFSLEDELPHIYLVGSKNELLFWMAGSLSRGINHGIERASTLR